MKLIIFFTLFSVSAWAQKAQVRLYGDSLSVSSPSFGSEFELLATTKLFKNIDFHRKAVVSHASRDWEPTFASENHSRPELVIFALGTNDAAKLCEINTRNRVSMAGDLLNHLKPGQRCIWIGPVGYTQGPVITRMCGTVAKYNRFVDALRETAKEYNCLFLDSRQIRDYADKNSIPNPPKLDQCVLRQGNTALTADRGDDLHFDYRDGGIRAKYWARCTALQIEALQKGSNGAHGFEFMTPYQGTPVITGPPPPEPLPKPAAPARSRQSPSSRNRPTRQAQPSGVSPSGSFKGLPSIK